ncbi:MAG: hypothetical protein AAGA92_05415 [Planctomycetota bacterium]
MLPPLPPSFDEWLSMAKEALAENCRQHVGEPLQRGLPVIAHIGKRYVVLDLGDGWLPYCVPKNAPDQVEDAFQAFGSLRVLEGNFHKGPGGLTDWDVRVSFGLGLLMGRMHFARPLEEFAGTGEKVRRGGAEGGKMNAAASEVGQQAIADECQKLVDDGYSIRAATGEIATKHCVSQSTVRRYWKARYQ